MILHNAHQPFLFVFNNITFLLFCKKTHVLKIQNKDIVIWSIFLRNLLTSEEVRVFNTDNRIECNPSVHIENNQCILNYVASDVIHDNTCAFNYKLKRIKLNENMQPSGAETDVANTFSGFETLSNIFYYHVHGMHAHVCMQSKTQQTLQCKDISHLTGSQCRIIPVFNTENIIITDTFTQRSFYIKNYDFNNAEAIKNMNQQDIYKCSFLGDLLVYAKKIGENFEDRDLVFESGFTI